MYALMIDETTRQMRRDSEGEAGYRWNGVMQIRRMQRGIESDLDKSRVGCVGDNE